MSKTKYDVIFYYSKLDTAYVQRLAYHLIDQGISVWLDQWEIIPGQDARQPFEEALNRSRSICICFGKRHSGLLDEQILSPLLLSPSSPPLTTIPILLPNAQPERIPQFLCECQLLDFSLDFSYHELNKLLLLLLTDAVQEELLYVLDRGDAYREENQLAEALSAYRHAVLLTQQTSGPQHPLVATIQLRIGAVQRALGHLEEARDTYTSALSIDSLSRGIAHPAVAHDLLHLGQLQVELGCWSEALDCYRRAAYIEEITYGPQSPRIARVMNHLGELLRNCGQLTQAREAFERALAIDRIVLGPQDPQVITDLNNMGGVLSDLGKVSEAKVILQQAESILRQTLEPMHPLALITEQNLSLLMLCEDDSDKDYSQVEQHLRESLEVARNSQIGKLSYLLASLGAILGAQGNDKLAECYLQEGLELARQMKQRGRISLLLTNLGTLAIKRKQYKLAEQYLQEGLELAREIGYRDNTSIILLHQAILASRQENDDLAISILHKAQALTKQMNHRERTRLILTHLGIIAQRQGNMSRAKHYFQQSHYVMKYE